MLRKQPFLLAFFLVLLSISPAAAQIQLKLQWLPDSVAWGVFARMETGVSPSENLVTGSGQVTLVAPVGYGFKNLKSFSGTWEQNATVSAPPENPQRAYISFGLLSNEPAIPLSANEETLLFTFEKREKNCPDTLYLISNDDPFAKIPNSVNSNPGNDLTVMDFGGRRTMYGFTENYAPEAWNCNSGKQVKQVAFIQSGRRKRLPQNRP